jgi:hypothetical protein
VSDFACGCWCKVHAFHTMHTVCDKLLCTEEEGINNEKSEDGRTPCLISVSSGVLVGERPHQEDCVLLL